MLTELPRQGLVYDLPNAVYQSLPEVSNSDLKWYRKSPFHYFARCLQPVPEVFLTDDDEDDPTGALFAGTLCHCATLEPDQFDRRYVVGPAVKTRGAKAWKEFVAANPERVAITPKQYATALGQAASLRRLDAVAEILEGGQCEVSAFWTDPATGIGCRCRTDCVNREFGTPRQPMAMILDLKSTQDASRRGMQAAIARLGYHHQCVWYSTGYALASHINVAGFIFAFVESKYPFAARVVELDAEAWDVAARENRQALEALARCRQRGEWPGYSAEVENVGLPRWAGGSGGDIY